MNFKLLGESGGAGVETTSWIMARFVRSISYVRMTENTLNKIILPIWRPVSLAASKESNKSTDVQIRSAAMMAYVAQQLLALTTISRNLMFLDSNTKKQRSVPSNFQHTYHQRKFS